MCFCTSRQSQAQRQQLKELTEPITQIFGNTTQLSIINCLTEDVLYDNSFANGELFTPEQLRGYIAAHQSACEMAQLYKEKNCPIMHLEQRGVLVSIYQILPTWLLVFASSPTSDLMLADSKMKPVLQRLIDQLEGRDDK